MAQTTEVSEVLAAYVRENFLYTRPDFPLTSATPLLEQSVVDSMGVVEIVEFLQERFEIDVGDDEITEDNFRTIAAITSYVQGKQAVA